MSVPVAFCFDNNFARQASVAIASLRHYANVATQYKVYCITSPDVTEENKQEILKLTNEKLSVVFIEAGDDFDNAHQHRKITVASYFRLKLHKLLPHEERVIYLDVDVLLHGDLSEAFNAKLGSNLIAGVKNLYIHQVFEKHVQDISYWQEKFGDSKNTYINAGFLIMNLAEIRKTGIWQEWVKLSRQAWEYHDQDILNFTCKGKIMFLPPAYNATYSVREKGAEGWSLFSKEELSAKPIVYHFTASKPWNAKYMDQAKVWWDFVHEHTPLYRYFLERYRRVDTFSRKIERWSRKLSRLPKRIARIFNL